MNHYKKVQEVLKCYRCCFGIKRAWKGEILHSFGNSKGKMVISHLEKYGQILYQKIALRVRVPMQQTARDFEFSSPSYARFSKMCLAGRGALDMSSGESRHVECPSGRFIFCGFWTEGHWTCRVGHLNMSRGTWGHSFNLLFTYKTPLTQYKPHKHIPKPF